MEQILLGAKSRHADDREVARQPAEPHQRQLTPDSPAGLPQSSDCVGDNGRAADVPNLDFREAFDSLTQHCHYIEDTWSRWMDYSMDKALAGWPRPKGCSQLIIAQCASGDQ